MKLFLTVVLALLFLAGNCLEHTDAGVCNGGTSGNCNEAIDVLIVLDRSFSISYSNWLQLVDGMKNLVGKFSTGLNDAHWGVIAWETRAVNILTISSNADQTQFDVQESIEAIPKNITGPPEEGLGGWGYTNPVAALDATDAQLANGIRGNGVKQAVIFVTDGNPTIFPGAQPDVTYTDQELMDGTMLRAAQLKSSYPNMKLVTIGVGPNDNAINFTFLANVASSSDMAYNLTTFDTSGIDAIKQDLVRRVCTTVCPTNNPTTSPTTSPTKSPTKQPTNSPTKSPTSQPTTKSPTTKTPTAPTGSPTTKSPTTKTPTAPTGSPTTKSPTTKTPTNAPTLPTSSPTKSPTNSPTTKSPTLPTSSPTKSPTKSPTLSPTKSPTTSPTLLPTLSPTKPTRSPFQVALSPTFGENIPTNKPTEPTQSPTKSPSKSPTKSPTKAPTLTPTSSPTTSPTKSPSLAPTSSPTLSPTTSSPTLAPTSAPTSAPTTSSPTASPVFSCGGSTPRTIFVMIDLSNSMNRTAISLDLKDYLNNLQILISTNPESRLGVGIFKGNMIRMIIEPQSHTSTEFRTLVDAMYADGFMEIDGNTPTAEAFHLGRRILTDYGSDNHTHHFLMITDGEPNPIKSVSQTSPAAGVLPDTPVVWDHYERNDQSRQALPVCGKLISDTVTAPRPECRNVTMIRYFDALVTQSRLLATGIPNRPVIVTALLVRDGRGLFPEAHMFRGLGNGNLSSVKRSCVASRDGLFYNTLNATDSRNTYCRPLYEGACACKVLPPLVSLPIEKHVIFSEFISAELLGKTKNLVCPAT